MCCRDVKFNSISFIVPIYGIICNIVILGIINKEKIKYKCQLQGFNEEIDELVDEQYNNNSTIIIMSSFSIAFYIVVLILLLCLKYMRTKSVDLYPATTVMPPSSIPLPVYPKVIPSPYGTNVVYPNMFIVPQGSYGNP